MVNILIVDDHPVVVEGLKAMLNQLPHIHVAGSAADGREAMEFLHKSAVEVVLLDINLPDTNGIELCQKIKKEFPVVKVLGISNFGDRSYISRLIDAGALGYLIKNAKPEEITDAIQTVMQNRLYLSLELEHILTSPTIIKDRAVPELTKREKEVLQLIADGLTNNEIAGKLFISPLTVDSHRKNLLTKLNVKNTAALIKTAASKGLL